MLGIDLTKISRFKNVSDALIKKVLHSDEISMYNKAKNKANYLAARSSIKEALYKADNKNISFSNILIEQVNGQYVFPGYKISTSNEDDYYIAIVMKENNER